MYLIDVDPARYAGPAGQRVMLRVGDQPRNVTIGTQDEICVQLQRVEGNSEVISARVRALRPEPQTAAEVRLVGPNIAPGTYRSTPWGLLLRAMPGNTDAQASDDRRRSVPTTRRSARSDGGPGAQFLRSASMMRLSLSLPPPCAQSLR